jgi:hypothetical protein
VHVLKGPSSGPAVCGLNCSSWLRHVARPRSVTSGIKIAHKDLLEGDNQDWKPCNGSEAVIERRAGMRVVLRGNGGSSSRRRSEIGDVIACSRSEDLAAFVDCHSNDSPSSSK